VRHAIAAILFGVPAAWPSAPVGVGHPLGLNRNHPYGIISNAYETPHVKWAVPYAGGTIKALVLAPQWSQRETVELAQRLSLRYTAWMSETFTQMTTPARSDPAFAGMQPPPAVVYRCLRQCLGKDYDVIIVGRLDWAMLPGEQRLELLEKVSDGAGLVYVGPPAGNKELDIVFGGKQAPEGRAFIARAVPIAALPAFRAKSVNDVINTSLFGKGRVVVLGYGDEPPKKWCQGWPCLTPQWGGPHRAYSDEYHKPKGYVPPDDCAEMEFVPYEYYQSLVTRATLWASGKETPARLARIALPQVVGYPVSAHGAQVTTASAPSGAVLKAVVRGRYEYGRMYDMASQTAGGKNRLSLPALPAGEYILDVWLMSGDGNVFDWASAAFVVKADVDVRKITLAGRRYDPGDRITGEVRLSRSLSSREVLVAELWDNYSRKIDERQLQGTGDGYSFSFAVARPLTIMHYIRARVERQGIDVCARRMSFPIRAKLNRLDAFNEVVWSGAGNQLLTHLMLRKLSARDQAGAIDVGFSGATHARNIAAANLLALPYTTGFGHFGNYKDCVVPTRSGARAAHGCMSNPDTLKAVDRWFGVQSDIYGPYGPLAWTHGDKSYYGRNPDVCWSETCLAAFREYLRGVYPDLSALNREWNTKYADWDEAKPITYEEAKKSGEYAPWLEHRLSAQRVWARLYARTGEALSKNDPDARPGFDGPQGLALPNGGINWWVLKDHVGILQDYVYNSQSMEIFRSFATPRHLCGMWYGTYGLTWQIGPNTVPYHHFLPWYSLFHGLNSTWHWTMGSPGPLSGYAPDLTNLPFFAASRQSLKEIRSGIFKLICAGRRANDGIAIHYSGASHVADSLYSDDKRSTAWMESLADFNHAVEDSGLQYEYVSYEEIAQDKLRKGRFRVLIMPHSRAVSAAEAQAIRQFVQEGGLLIADLLPGILNGHGTKPEQSMLAGLFPSTDHGVVNTIGKGKTVLLGKSLAGYGHASYRHMRGWRTLGGRCEVLANLLAEHAGVTPTVRISHRGDGDLPPTEIVRFQIGDTELVGLLRKYFLYDNTPYSVNIRFAEKRHVYDVRTGKYLGVRDRLTTDLSYQAHLYARLPYKVKSVALNVRASAGRTTPSVVKIALETSGAKPVSAHVLQMRVLSPNGRELPWYTRKTVAPAGRAEADIPWALNEAPGRYTVAVRDVASGTIAQREVSLP